MVDGSGVGWFWHLLVGSVLVGGYLGVWSDSDGCLIFLVFGVVDGGVDLLIS